jgi:outer membrane translocation and assembly module TamA
VDVGNAWVLAPGHAPSGADAGGPLRVGVGVGVRRATPIGPVQVDVGVNPWRRADRGEGLARVHLTLGAL